MNRLNLGLVDVLMTLADALLRPADVRALRFLDVNRVKSLLRGRPGRHTAAFSHKLWSYHVCSMLRCELWVRLFLDRAPSPRPRQTLAELV